MNLLHAKLEALGAAIALNAPAADGPAPLSIARWRSNGAKALGKPVALTAPALGEQNPLAVARWRHNGAEVQVSNGKAVSVVMSLAENRAERLSEGRTSFARPRIGSVSVADPEQVTRYRLQGRTDVFQVVVPLREVARAAGPGRSPRIRARFHEPEPELERCMARAFVLLHERGLPDPLLLSSIALRLSHCLIDAPRIAESRAVGGLAPGNLRRVEELIAARASEPVAASPTLAELAAEASLSVSHFAREFRRTVGQTPYAYMLRRRIERARELTVRSDLPLAEVGRRSGFPSPAHFADCFRREAGVTPSALRRASNSWRSEQAGRAQGPPSRPPTPVGGRLAGGCACSTATTCRPAGSPDGRAGVIGR